MSTNNARSTLEKQLRYRNDIKTQCLIKQLQEHVIENKPMSTSQIKAAEILLKKTLPDLKQLDITSEGGTSNLVVQILNQSKKFDDEVGLIK